MATKMRLQRGGRKGHAFYRIVIADSNAPRDGRFTEKLGTYDPNTNPATINLNFERALYWLETGAQPTDTMKSILSKEGVLLMKHLRGGVRKGAFSEEVAQQKFDAWKQEKEQKLQKAASEAAEQKRNLKKERLAAEKAVDEAIAKKVAEKKAALLQAQREAEAAAVAAQAAPEATEEGTTAAEETAAE